MKSTNETEAAVARLALTGILANPKTGLILCRMSPDGTPITVPLTQQIIDDCAIVMEAAPPIRLLPPRM